MDTNSHTAEQTFCYVARKEGAAGAYAACSANAEFSKEAAKFCASEIRRGAMVERVTTEKARELLTEYLKWREADEKRNKELFA